MTLKAKWFCMFCLLLPFIGCQNDKNAEKSATIALYSDQGAWDESVRALKNMFQWMNYSVALIDADYLNERGLSTFRVLCIPGGDMYQYSQDISSVGKEAIRDFVRNGGGYIGICGGSYFAGEEVYWQGNQLDMTPLCLFEGSARGPMDAIVPHPDYGMCQVNVTDSLHFITQSEPDTAWMLYYWGPILLPNSGANVTILGKYDAVNQPAILAFDYEEGRVFLIGTHPEIEEDSDRDSVETADELFDRGSDWDLMRKATRWCLKENN